MSTIILYVSIKINKYIKTKIGRTRIFANNAISIIRTGSNYKIIKK